jgi:asparagine synthase (glutamine-hydrolysing)
VPGLVAVSWAPDRAARARELFSRVAGAYARLKGLEASDTTELDGLRIARFAARAASNPAIFTGADGVRLAAAGWWFDPDAPADAPPSLERLAAAWRRDREAALDRLQGHYLVAVAERGDLVGAVDQLGLFPVYVAEADGIAWLATSAAVLAAVLRPALDVEALRALFMENAIRSPRSAFAGIRRVGLGERVVLAGGRVRVSRVWTPFRSARAYARIEDAADEGSALLREACRRIRRVWPRAVSDLTSGLDSRLVVAALAEPDVPVAVTVNGPADNLDVVTARQIAARFGWPLRHQSLPADWGRRRWPLFQRAVGLADGELPGHAVDGTLFAKLGLAPDFDASLTGGGGELYREFFWQQEYLRIGRTPVLDVGRLLRYRFFPSVSPETSLFRADWRAHYVADQTDVIRSIVAMAPDALNTAKLDAVYMWKSSGHVGRYAGAMWPLVAAPAPLATARLVEYAIALPWRYRMAGRLVRQMITRMHPALAALPTSYGGSAEPIRLTRPDQVLPYVASSAARLVRKLGQVTIRHPIIPNPTVRVAEPAWERDLVATLGAERFLDPEHLRTASLYDPDGLGRFLARAHAGDVTAFSQLSAIVSIEILCRLCDLDPRGERL